MNMTSVAYPDFTSSLRETLLQSRSSFDEFVGREKARADACAEQIEKARKVEQEKIDQAVTNLLAFELQGGLVLNDVNVKQKKSSLEDEKENVQQKHARVLTDIDRLQNELEEKKARIEQLNLECKRQRARTDEVRKKKERIEIANQTTVEELTCGIVNYKYLGLDFEKAGNNELRFCFSQIDPSAPQRKFSFLLGVDDATNLWKVKEHEPQVDPNTLETLLDAQNRNNDLQVFVRGMRKAFIDTI